jgi:hypothetical protein
VKKCTTDEDDGGDREKERDKDTTNGKRKRDKKIMKAEMEDYLAPFFSD